LAQREQAFALGARRVSVALPNDRVIVAADDGGASHVLSNTDLISETDRTTGASQAFRATSLSFAPMTR